MLNFNYQWYIDPEWNINGTVTLEIDFFIYALNNIFKSAKARELILSTLLFFKMTTHGRSEKGTVTTLRTKRKQLRQTV